MEEQDTSKEIVVACEQIIVDKRIDRRCTRDNRKPISELLRQEINEWRLSKIHPILEKQGDCKNLPKVDNKSKKRE